MPKIPSYWTRWAEEPHSDTYNPHPYLSYLSWQKVQALYDFLTKVEDFISFPVSASNLVSDLKDPRHTFDIGDLVFYGSPGSFEHVAVISSRWAPQTFFGAFPLNLNPDAVQDDWSKPMWTAFMVYQDDTPERKQAFANEALDIWRLFRCEAVELPWLPRVVERSGAILYHGSRSINNTNHPQSSFTIVHIGD